MSVREPGICEPKTPLLLAETMLHYSSKRANTEVLGAAELSKLNVVTSKFSCESTQCFAI